MIERAALAALPIETERTIDARTALGSAALDVFRCDALSVGGRALGARLIALSDQRLGPRYQGLWYDEGKEAAERHGLAVD